MSRPLRYIPTDRPSRGRDFVIFIVLVFLALGFVAIGQHRQAYVAQQVRRSVLYPFLRLHGVFEQHAVTMDRTRRLEAERDSLAAELSSARQTAMEVSQLRRVLGLGALDSGGYVLADIVPGQPRVGASHTFVLSRGRADRVDPPVGVLAGQGIVGVVRSAARSFAIGDFWTHPEFRVSVRTQSGSAVGIVRPRQAEDGRWIMELEGTPFQEDVRLGSLLVTSGLSGIYPAGIPVGTVQAVSEVYAGWAKSYLVEPAAQPEEASVVLVWLRPVAPREDSTAAADEGPTAGTQPMSGSDG
jgi:rod shape-determining protein MreC